LDLLIGVILHKLISTGSADRPCLDQLISANLEGLTGDIFVQLINAILDQLITARLGPAPVKSSNS
jgi:hypothetical protein